MSLLKPTIALRHVTDISVTMLKQLGIDAILLDVDNTLAPPTSHIPYEGVQEWIDTIKAAGIHIIICGLRCHESEAIPLRFYPCQTKAQRKTTVRAGRWRSNLYRRSRCEFSGHEIHPAAAPFRRTRLVDMAAPQNGSTAPQKNQSIVPC